MSRAMLFEELLILWAYSNPDGISRRADRIHFDLGAAVLAELALTDRIHVELANPEGLSGRYHPSKDVLAVSDRSPLGDPETDAILEPLQTTAHPSPRQWIVNATRSLRSPTDDSTLAQRLVDRFTDNGTFRAHRHKTLGLFASQRFVLTNPSTAAGVRNDLDQLLHGAEPDPRTATLALLLFAPYASIAFLGHTGGNSRDTKELWRKLSNGDWGTPSQRQAVGAIVAGVEACKRG